MVDWVHGAPIRRFALCAVLLAATFALLLASQITHTSTDTPSQAGHAPLVATLELSSDPQPTTDMSPGTEAPADTTEYPSVALLSLHVLYAIVSLGLLLFAVRVLWRVFETLAPPRGERPGLRPDTADATKRPLAILDEVCVLRV